MFPLQLQAETISQITLLSRKYLAVAYFIVAADLSADSASTLSKS